MHLKIFNNVYNYLLPSSWLKAFWRLVLFETNPQLSTWDMLRLQQVFIDWLIDRLLQVRNYVMPTFIFLTMSSTELYCRPSRIFIGEAHVNQHGPTYYNRWRLPFVICFPQAPSLFCPHALGFSVMGPCSLICVFHYAVPSAWNILPPPTHPFHFTKTYSFCNIQLKDWLLFKLFLPCYSTEIIPLSSWYLLSTYPMAFPLLLVLVSVGQWVFQGLRQ